MEVDSAAGSSSGAGVPNASEDAEKVDATAGPAAARAGAAAAAVLAGAGDIPAPAASSRTTGRKASETKLEFQLRPGCGAICNHCQKEGAPSAASAGDPPTAPPRPPLTWCRRAMAARAASAVQ